LQAFLITEVSVEKTLIDGKRFLPKEVMDPEWDENGRVIGFYGFLS
jgi:hypothetical protein